MTAADLAKMIEASATSHAKTARIALDTADRSMVGKLSALESAWIAAQADEHARIPTTLSLAIINMLGFRVSPEPKPDWADGKHDLDVRGMPLKPGT